MSNTEVTQIDVGSVEIKDGEFRDELLTLAGPDSLLAGTILARDSSSLKLRLFVKGGSTNENGIPKAVLTYPVVSETSGSHDVAVRVLVAGTVNKKRLVIDADGDDSNIDGKVVDQLRDYHIVPLEVEQLGSAETQEVS